MKKVIIGSILVVSLAAGFAFAHGNGNGFRGNHMGSGGYGMMGQGMMGSGMMGNYQGKGGWGDNDCPGASWFSKGGWNSDEHQKFLDESAGLRKQMNEKMFEFSEAGRSPDANSEQLATLEKELIDIRSMIHKKAEELSVKAL